MNAQLIFQEFYNALPLFIRFTRASEGTPSAKICSVVEDTEPKILDLDCFDGSSGVVFPDGLTVALVMIRRFLDRNQANHASTNKATMKDRLADGVGM